MARNATRQREFSLRLALGAQRGEVLRQLLTESLLLVALGGALAWGFAELATRVLGRWALIESSLAPDKTVLLFTLGALLFAAVLFGVAPFRVAVAGGAELALKTSAATSSTDAGKTQTGRIIVAAQMALCVVLLVAGGLLIRTLRNLENIPLGMQTEGRVVFGLNPQRAHSAAELVLFYQELQRRLRMLPGVESVAMMQYRLGSGWSNNTYVGIDGKDPVLAKGTRTMMMTNDVGPDFFHTLGVPVLLGREFVNADTATSQPVAVVNVLFAQQLLPGQNPLGHRVNDRVIVGVVKNHKYEKMDEGPSPMAWYDYAQSSEVGEMNVEMQVHGDALAILPAVRKVVAQMDPDLPLIQPVLQRTQFEQTISQQLMFARLAEFFGLLAIVLVATGLYGTLAYRVNMRTAEIGVRMAVGAPRKQIVWMILRDSLLLTAIGVVVGVPLAMVVGRALTASLYGVKPSDVVSYLLAMVGVVLVALTASAVPAARAASVDPLTALRTE
jgi:predicted permease